MARSSKSSGESNVVVVVFLVLFVLSTIGLGVYAYQTNEQLVEERGKVKKADEEKTAAAAIAADASQESLMYQAALGLFKPRARGAAAAETAGEGEKKADADGFPSGKITDREKAKKIYDRIVTELGKRYDEAVAKQPAEYKDALDAAKKGAGPDKDGALPKYILDWNFPVKGDIDSPKQSLIETTVVSLVDQEKRRRLVEAERASLASQRTDFNNQAAAAAKDQQAFKDAAKAFPEQVRAVKEESDKKFDAAVNQFAETTNASRKEAESKAKEAQDKSVEANKLADRLKKVDARLAELIDKQLELIDPFQFDRPQGRILRRYSDSLVDIDLGSSDKLRPGVAFSIFPSDTTIRGMQPRMRPFRDADGKVAYRPIPKGKLEVIEVIGPNIAQCRIIDEDNAVRDRIIPGDLLYNALWRKGVSERVALYGIFDLDGDGRDDMQGLIAGLRRVGVVVDAYYDLGAKKWVGEITSQTNFGVEGFSPTASAQDGNREEKLAVLEQLRDARKYVKESGVMILKPRDFFPRVGFNARLDVPADAINQAATGFGKAGAPAKPAAENPPMADPAKPMEPKN